MTGGERLKLSDCLLMKSDGQQGVDPRFLDPDVQLLQPGPLGGGERSAVNVGQRRSTPQIQGHLQRCQGALGVPAHQRVAAGRGQPVEAPRVELAIVDMQAVAGRPGLQPACLAQRAQRSPQFGQPDLEVGRSTVRARSGQTRWASRSAESTRLASTSRDPSAVRAPAPTASGSPATVTCNGPRSSNSTRSPTLPQQTSR